MNRLYYGDNLDVMRQMRIASVDLIYLDPPFKTNQDYNIIYRTLTGKPVPEQEQAFCDTWQMDAEKEKIARSMPVLMRDKGIDDYYVEFWRLWVQALRHTQPHLMAYLIYMVQRLLYMKPLLRPKGSIYLHCDPEASHYIKVMMDGIFGHQNFRNEIIWKRTTAHSASRRWNDVHDCILFYTKGEEYTWNRVLTAHSPEYLSRFKRQDESGSHWTDDNLTAPGVRHGESGKAWRGFDPTAKGLHWKVSNKAVEEIVGAEAARELGTLEKLDVLDNHGLIYWPIRAGEASFPRFKRYLGAGVPIQDVVTDIGPLNSQSRLRLGYQTQKPPALLRRIIEASSNAGDVVFDPFCGCGTSIYAAQEMNRAWIGCDIAILAIRLVRQVLIERYRLAEGTDFTVNGIPVSVEEAEELFKHDPFQFQHWAVERVGGFPTQKKSGDLGIDGRIYFETREALKSMVLSVKGGIIRPTDVRDLRGVLEREEGAELAGFISLRNPTPAMHEEASRAGIFDYAGFPYRRIQLLTVREVLEEKRDFQTPTKVGVRGISGQAPLPFPPREA